MATTTPNFGWSVPTSTDLVKDGATAIETLGDSVDASMGDLLGGTTGQILAKNSNTNMDFIWQTPNVGDITEVQAGVGISVASGTGPIPVITNSSTDLITTAGDLLYGTAADTVARLGIGTANQVLAVNSGATAPEWVTPSTGAVVLLTSGTMSGTAVSFNNVFSSTYDNYRLFWNCTDTDGAQRMRLRVSGSDNTTSNYYFVNQSVAFGGTPAFGNLSNASGTDYWLDLPVGSAGNRYRWEVGFTGFVDGSLIDQVTYNGFFTRFTSHGGVSFGSFGAGTAFDGFTVYNTGSTWSGNYALVAYKK